MDGESAPYLAPLSDSLPPGMVESSSPSHQRGAPPELSSAALDEPSRPPGRMSPGGAEIESVGPSSPAGSQAGSKSRVSSRQPSKEADLSRRPSKLSQSQASRRPSFRNSKSELDLTDDPSSPGGAVKLKKLSPQAAGAEEGFGVAPAGTSYSDVEPFGTATARPSGAQRPSGRLSGVSMSSGAPRSASHGSSAAAEHFTAAEPLPEGMEPPPEEAPPEAPPPTAEEVYEELRAEFNGRPLELAVLARLKVWKRGHRKYSVKEIMDLVRWMEARTEPEPSRTSLLWQAFRRAKTQYRLLAIVFAVLLGGIFLVILAAVTAAALIITTPAPIATNGLLMGSQEQPAGVAAAMHPYSLLDYELLSAGQLRRAEDAVLQQHGDFHYYRLAGATQLMSGGVRLAAQDGSVIRVEDSAVSLKPAWSIEEVVDADGMARLAGAKGSSSLSFAGAFRALSPH